MKKMLFAQTLPNIPFILWQVLLPLFIFFLFTPWSASLDQQITQIFYNNGRFASHPLLIFFYEYGFMPAWALAGLAAITWCGSYCFSFLKRWRQAALFLLLTLAIGPGLIIHAILKDHWGRPRPKQVIEYGGQQFFRAFYEPHFSQPEPSKSFPCGHCSMGFYFFALALLGKHYQNKYLYYAGMGMALGLGGFLSFVRIAQGGHFFSDTLVSALIMWLIPLGLYPLLLKNNKI